jgi:hypothetical protein
MSAPAATPTPSSSGHTSRAKDPAIVREAQKPIEFISGILGTAAIGLVVLFLIFWGRGCANDRKAKKAEARQAATIVATTYTPTTQVVKVGKEPTTYNYKDSPDQCVERNMTTHDFHWYLQGGKAMVYPPHGNKSFLDIPGKKVVYHIQPGVWKWCKTKEDPDATGVEIWE